MSGYEYCVLHADPEERNRHIQSSDDHPQCHICVRQYKDRNALQNHWVVANYHYYCRECDKHFNCAVGLEFHIDEIHVGDDDPDVEDEYGMKPHTTMDGKTIKGWTDILTVFHPSLKHTN